MKELGINWKNWENWGFIGLPDRDWAARQGFFPMRIDTFFLFPFSPIVKLS